jgi:competence protein ComEA
VQLALAFLLGAAASLPAVQSFGFWRWASRPSELEQKTVIIYRVNLNQADRAELQQLPGVGPALAQRIEEHRAKTGGFRNVEELRQVHGIGPATLEQLRQWVYVDAPDEPAPTPGPDKQAPPPGGMGAAPKKITNPNEPINLNRASAEELRQLPGIGPKLSQLIMDERQKRPFQSVDDLRRVRGIGPKTIERLRPYATTENRPAAVAGAE